MKEELQQERRKNANCTCKEDPNELSKCARGRLEIRERMICDLYPVTDRFARVLWASSVSFKKMG